VVRRQFHVHVENTEVYLGNSALIKCAIPEYVRPYVRVASWHRGEEILLPDLSDVGECCHILTGGGVYRQLKFMCQRFGFVARQQWNCTFCCSIQGWRLAATGRMTFIGECCVYAAGAGRRVLIFPCFCHLCDLSVWFPNSGTLCGPGRLRGSLCAFRAFRGRTDEVQLPGDKYTERRATAQRCGDAAGQRWVSKSICTRA